MLDLTTKKVLLIDLEKKEADVKTFVDLNSYFGGVGLALKLLEIYHTQNPTIFSVGPLNGFYPYASKTAVVLQSEGAVEDLYLGGSLSLRIRFAGVDAIVFVGKSETPVIVEIQNTYVTFLNETTDIHSLGLPGKRSVVSYDNRKVLLDGYFTTPENYLEKDFVNRNLLGFVVTGTEIFQPQHFDEYQKLYGELLKRGDLSVEAGVYPSCSNCPMGCGKSKNGALGGNVLINSLVACQYADRIYTDIGITFSCLNTLGYNYTHEDIENLPKLIEETIRKITA